MADSSPTSDDIELALLGVQITRMEGLSSVPEGWRVYRDHCLIGGIYRWSWWTFKLKRWHWVSACNNPNDREGWSWNLKSAIRSVVSNSQS